METLVAAHHRNQNHNQYYGRKRGRGSTKFGSCGSAPAKNFWGNSCRTYESAAGLIPTPLKSASTPVSKKSFYASRSSRTSPSSVNNSRKCSEQNARRIAGPIPIKLDFEKEGKLHFSESWAGTACSISPPPSSLPLPVFALRPRRTVSLDLPKMVAEIDLPPIAKSAPTSPARGCSPSASGLFDSIEYATTMLRRILNLEVIDE
ncbi:uncharacterized protein LOC127244165 [Andrographis paniculata]|uniref:uncharacterized protein LOC127244165 n=1 Tax=Andrographis paniculata TaxID=175694 RepID=UPI0021E89F6D|nr:uncharacterized protein LOC127244165 [Andrographis paniculata]